jgi:hypothetical protein
MWSKSYSIVTKDATKEQLWKLITDINRWHTWDSTVERAELLGEFKAGTYFLLKPKGAPQVKIKLIAVEENRKFVDMTSFPLAKMYGEHTYEDTPDGLKVTVTMKVEGLLSFLWIKLVAQDIVNHLPEDLAQQVKVASQL